MNKELIRKVVEILTPEDVSALRDFRPKAIQQIELLNPYMKFMDPKLIYVNTLYKDVVRIDDEITHFKRMIEERDDLKEEYIIEDAKKLYEELGISLDLLSEVSFKESEP